MLVAFPIFSLIFMLKKKDLENDETRLKYGTMYLNLDLKKRASRYMPFMFLGRRLMLGCSIAFFKYQFIQIYFSILSSLGLIMYLLKVMPYEDKLLNVIELFNEMSLLACSYTLLAFTDYVDDVHRRSEIGWFYASLVSVNFAVNWLTLFYRFVTGTLFPACRNIKSKCSRNEDRV